jgi:predicted dienelactone hydrolase
MRILCDRNEFDEKHVCVVGHSRGGKTALLASAIDERFFMSISNCSGNSGAALSRNSTGETIKDIMTRFPYWFNDNYKKFIDNEDALPFDQHHLIALQAQDFIQSPH